MRRKGYKVIDKNTGTLATIVDVRAEPDDDDGRIVAYYLLSDEVPLSANYPTRWRWSAEVESTVSPLNKAHQLRSRSVNEKTI
jgi:hypothetical protein